MPVGRSLRDSSPLVGRNRQGVRIMGLKEGDKIASLARVPREENEAPEREEAPRRRLRSPEGVQGRFEPP